MRRTVSTNIVIEDEGRGHNLSFVLEKDETVKSHANTLTQREEGDAYNIL